MEAKELMVGDLVLDYDNRPVKIRQILKYRVLVDNSRRQYENFGDIKPIPLAEEILEKNGFVRQEEERGFSEPYILYINDDYGYPIKIYPKFYMDKAHHLYIGYDDEGGTYLSLYTVSEAIEQFGKIIGIKLVPESEAEYWKQQYKLWYHDFEVLLKAEEELAAKYRKLTNIVKPIKDIDL